ncbi:transcriptional repressor [Cyclobacterium xiamenense]|jgi:AcrR family transcriptional regulator|uniref:Transcriptional repressor n=1 Tax=Cyclobacterium xiamenense TaxID=1297121 RepID=A0A1H6ZT05_9BACT|nr:TetR/AcrR family transcriptional regulator [Cyclobacterium xiamenense]SEJ54717.1 transcriptional repressor [Cyclobacterium xiamenense]
MDLPAIIEKSLPVLNEKGYQGTDMDRLIDQLQIRPSDLYRDVRDFDDLIVRIFYRLCNESDAAAAEIDQNGSSLEKLYTSTLASYRIQEKYRFFFLDLGTIINRHEAVKDRYFELISLRKTQLIHLFHKMSQENVFEKENFTGSFENLANQMTMLSDYWPIHNLVIFGQDSFHHQYYSKLVFSMVLPFLTDEGLRQYKKILGYER